VIVVGLQALVLHSVDLPHVVQGATVVTTSSSLVVIPMNADHVAPTLAVTRVAHLVTVAKVALAVVTLPATVVVAVALVDVLHHHLVVDAAAVAVADLVVDKAEDVAEVA
jgi:hypothetical protein